MAYVDGFIIPVPKKQLDAYRRMSRKPGGSGASTARSSTRSVSPTMFRWGKVTSFSQSVKRKKDETVVFAWISYKSRVTAIASMRR